MGRPKSFDVDEVLDRAVDLFWANGLAATSIEDLVNHLGINRGSLYSTFNSKEELYQRALDRYHQGSMETFRQILADDGRPLRDRLEGLMAMSATSVNHQGCFMMNTATERNSGDADCRAVTDAAIDDMSGLLLEAFEVAAEAGGDGNALADDGRTPITAGEATTLTLTAMQGLRALSTMRRSGTAEVDGSCSADRTITLFLNTIFGPRSAA
jgi:TetR/AcrR family transcriptional repressor of nem operon